MLHIHDLVDSSKRPGEVGTVFILVLLIKTVRLKAVKKLAPIAQQHICRAEVKGPTLIHHTTVCLGEHMVLDLSLWL